MYKLDFFIQLKTSIVGLTFYHSDNVTLNLKRKIISERQITDLIDIDKRFIEQQNPFQFIHLNKFYFD